jgi:lincosamide nucleotidyltransferase A/C/D/E
MNGDQVTALLAGFAAHGLRVWVAGGWAVDAVLGRQTRPHGDLDLAVDADHQAAAIEALGRLGFVVETDWRPVRVELAVDAARLPELLALLDRLGFVTTVDWLPVRAELTAPDGRKVDIHPVAFRPDGSGVQSGLDGVTFAYAADGFTEGVIAGRPVPCLSVAQQLRFRAGYPPRDIDHHDIALLRGITTTA